MRPAPTTPPIDEADPLSGHLWIQELVLGETLRFALREDGRIAFGTAENEVDDPPVHCQVAVDHVREHLDREGLRAAVDDPAAYTFVGVATGNRGIDYDWDRLPPFLGTDVVTPEGVRPPDAVAGIFERLGLEPINAVEREVPMRDFHPERYEMPDSAWYDGPAAGVILRDKRGGRARIERALASGRGDADPADCSATDLVERAVTPGRIDRIAATLRERGRPVTPEAVLERLVAVVAREVDPDAIGYRGVDPGAFRSAAAPVVRERLSDR